MRELGLHGPEVDLIVTAARVHDIGKIGTPDAVLNKPGKLDPAERAIMEQHPVTGVELLKRYGVRQPTERKVGIRRAGRGNE